MKSTVKIIILLCLFFMVACDGMNDLHEKYLKRGETIYTGIIDSLKVFPGSDRVKFKWEINSDPRIARTVVYWNEQNDSSVVEVNRTQSGRMQQETELDLPEGAYIFEFATKDNEGHQSLYVEQTVEIYGEIYRKTLRNRVIKTVGKVSNSSSKLVWFPIESSTIQYSTIRYKDYSNPDDPVEKEIRVTNEDLETVLNSVKSGDTFTIVTSYLPKNGLDILDASPTEYMLP